MTDLPKNSLVLYKQRPARVCETGQKLDIELEAGGTKSVRPKDVVLLHPGPLASLSDLVPVAGEVETAWDLLAGGTTHLAELAELAYGRDDPSAFWAAWQWVDQGMYFSGTPDRIQVRTREEADRLSRERDEKNREKEAWQGFLSRVKSKKLLPDDDAHLQPLAARALGRDASSKLLKEMGVSDTPEQAHRLLLNLGRWDETVNPYPARLGMPEDSPASEIGALPEEARLDLTHLEAFAVDDEGSLDPDDALSWDGERLWVHVADVAAMVQPDGELDLEARARGANLYLPEGTRTMLPKQLTALLALGLQERSPALSFGIKPHPGSGVADLVIRPSWVKVTRLTYAQAESMLDRAPFPAISEITSAFQEARMAKGAVSIDLPEVKISVADGQVEIRPQQRLRSREMVTESMLMAGEAAARFALEHDLPFVFASQPLPETADRPCDPAGMFALRKKLKRSQMSTVAEAHGGLGLAVYSRATSPLRRYLDLVVHQQLRAFLTGSPVLDGAAVSLRVGAAEAVVGGVVQAERLSNLHWTLVYLKRNPDWQGRAVLVERRGNKGIVLIPELGLETSVQLDGDAALNSELLLRLKQVRLEDQSVRFLVVS